MAIQESSTGGVLGHRELWRAGAALAFMLATLGYAAVTMHAVPGSMMLVAAAVIGAYMAMNIGANDVANNVGPAVGSRALSLSGAIAIAAVFEASGALIAGGDVVGTIKKDIIDPTLIADADTFVWLMMAALLAGALWLNLATALGAPVSTTHSIVGGVLGAGIAAGGPAIADWGTMGTIAASWVISPVLGGVIAAAFLYLIKRSVTYQRDMTAAARRMVPVLVAVMAWAFATYLMQKGLKRVWDPGFATAALAGLVIAGGVYAAVRPWVAAATGGANGDKTGVNDLFTIPLVFAAALLSFAHGANDVANAVGPLAAINDTLVHGAVAARATIPLWVMLVGALGIALGLALYGPRLIRTVGTEITELDKIRAYCIAMAAAITVIVASQLGLPVSSTHIAVGAVFGVGFLREMLKANYAAMVGEIKAHHHGADEADVEAFLARFQAASIAERGVMLKQLKRHSATAELSKQERKSLKRLYKQELVKRSHLIRIVSAWLVTVPMSAVMAAMLYFMLRGMLLD